MNRYMKALDRIAAEPKTVNEPALLTEPASRFVFDLDRVYDLLSFIVVLALDSDDKTRHILTAIQRTFQDDSFQTTIEQIGTTGQAVKAVQLRFWLLNQMAFCRAADNYLTYIADLLALVFKKRPETLRSSESVSLDLVLQHKDMNALIEQLAERKVNELSYMGLEKLQDYLDRKLGFQLFTDHDQLREAVSFIEFRNLIVHNRGVVNTLFASRLPDYQEQIGQPLRIESELVLLALTSFARSVTDIDNRAAEKWALDRPVELSSVREKTKPFLPGAMLAEAVEDWRKRRRAAGEVGTE